jgi:hypothetical protein
MVLTKAELIGALQHEVQILLHLASKVDASMVDYRPTPKQRSTLELLRYLSIMGPELVKAAKRGGFDVESWTAAAAAAEKRNFDETVAAIAAEKDFYASELGAMSDDDFRTEMDVFGRSKSSKGAFIVSMVLGGHAAYRTQLFVYLKACGREELSTMNLWAGMDAPAAAAV